MTDDVKEYIENYNEPQVEKGVTTKVQKDYNDQLAELIAQKVVQKLQEETI